MNTTTETRAEELSNIMIGANTQLCIEHNCSYMVLVERIDQDSFRVFRLDDEGKQYGELHIGEWYLVENTHLFTEDDYERIND